MRPNVFGSDFFSIDQSTLIGELLNRAERKPSYVVPTNLLHVLRLRSDAELRAAFADAAAFVVPDGRPLVWMAWLCGITMKLVTAADLVIPSCRAARERLSVYLFGATFHALG